MRLFAWLLLPGWEAVKAHFHCGKLQHKEKTNIVYKLTERAADDFAVIYDYTLLTFGEAQADLVSVPALVPRTF